MDKIRCQHQEEISASAGWERVNRTINCAPLHQLGEKLRFIVTTGVSFCFCDSKKTFMKSGKTHQALYN